MKRFTVILLLAVLTLSLFACGNKNVPEGQPTIRYNGVPLQTLTLLVHRTNGEISVGGDTTVAELVKEHIKSVPYAEISDGTLELVNGREEGITYSIVFSGIFDENGEQTNYTENALSSLPAGKYIICAQVTERQANFSSVYLYIAGIEKK